MANQSEIKPLADIIAAPILKAYRATRFGLVLILSGTLLLLAAVRLETNVSCYLLAAVGALEIVFALIHFYRQDIRTLAQAHASIERNRRLVNTIQQAAFEMTALARSLQTLMFEHADDVAFLIRTFRERLRSVKSIPFISSTPGIDKLTGFADDPYVVNVENLSASILRTTEDAKRMIDALHNALILSDPMRLEKCLEDLQGLDCRTKTLFSDRLSLVAQRQASALRPPSTEEPPL